MVASPSRRPWAAFVIAAIISLSVDPGLRMAEGQEPPGATAPGVIPDQYIVVLADEADGHAHARAAERAHGIGVFRVYEHAFKGFAFRGSPAAARALERSPQVVFVAQDRVVEAVAQTLPTGIDRIDADLNPISHINGIDDRVNVNVGILDTGIDPTHPDLNVVGGENCLGGTTFVDGHGHGSHVAGTAAALDNADGVVGVAPGARLFGIKVLNDGGSGSFSSVACGLDFAAGTRKDRDPGNDIAVVNLSLTGTGADDGNCGKSNQDVLHKAVCGAVARGVVVVVAAGNNARDASGFAPAAYDEAITVSAIADLNGIPGEKGKGKRINPDSFAGFSNFGADVDIAAPGVSIFSTFMSGGYATMSGTSMATPHVAGAVALYVAQHGMAIDAAGVDAIRQAITTPGGGFCVAQNDPRGFAGDPDAFPEPLLYVGPPAASAASLEAGSLAAENQAIAGGAVTSLELMAASPNPFNEATTLRYALPDERRVSIVVYDMAGRQVRHLLDRVESAGSHAVRFNGRDHRGERLGPGLYLVRLETAGESRAWKVLLSK